MSITKYKNIIRNNPTAVNIFIVIFYCVGIAGFILSASNALFLKLTPIALLLSFVLLMFFHETEITKKSLFAYFTIFLTTFAIEAIGVNTGIIFGNYTYGSGLGIQLFQTPLIIGINWVFLVYTTAAVVNKLNVSNFIKIVFASGAMVIYDIVLEQIAPKLDMWSWGNDVIPLQNYIVWFILALLFHTLLKILHIRSKNSFAAIILICQFMFFVVLLGAFKLIP